MFSKAQALDLEPSGSYQEQIEILNLKIAQANAIVIGAGAGLSTSAGLAYSGERFEQHFQQFIHKYHFRDMYSATFYPYNSLEEYWAYMSRHIYFNRYKQDGGEVYLNLLSLVKEKDYFVITTNVDHCFQRAGFNKERLFYTQGDYGLWQCSQPCHYKTYDNEEFVLQMVRDQKNLRIPTEQIPYCPVCGKPMSMNLRCDSTFVEDEGWKAASQRYNRFIQSHKEQHLLYLELGVGNNTPTIIKYPFWKMVQQNKKATYASINKGHTAAPGNIRKRSICIDSDIGIVLSDLINA